LEKIRVQPVIKQTADKGKKKYLQRISIVLLQLPFSQVGNHPDTMPKDGLRRKAG